jgi:hypothetical protein
MATPQEIEQAAGIDPVDEIERKRIWAAAQARASEEERAPAAEDLALAERMLQAARAIQQEHLAGGQGRATITLTDAEDGVDVALDFAPELEDAGPDEVAGTPAQIMALELAHSLLDHDEHGHDHDHPNGHQH